MGSPFCARLFLKQDIFWTMAMLGFFLVVALLHNFFSYYFALHDSFLVTANALPGNLMVRPLFTCVSLCASCSV